jgi:hypothetical protein
LALTGSVRRHEPFFLSIIEVPGIEIHGTPLPISRAITPCRTAEIVVTNW